jgi:hypothetical protein
MILDLVLVAALAGGGFSGLELRERWFYGAFNLWVDENVAQIEGLLRRAAPSGYNGLLLADSKFARLGDMDERYFKNVERVKGLARELGIEIVPAVFPIGYSNDLLFHDPHLAEALPVRDALFVVEKGAARPLADPPVAFRDLARWDWKDDNVAVADGTARVSDPKGANARIVHRLKVAPFRQYHIAVRVETRNFRGTPEIKAIAGDRVLNHASLGVKPTQDWKVHHAVFNSLEHSEVQVYLGAWGAESGSLAWAEPVIEEAGFLNLVRREGAPLAVRREDDAALVEGRDFEPLRDPRTGTVPYPGEYEVWHEPPPLRTSLLDGTRLRVSYHHAITIHDGQVMVCPSEPKTIDLLRDQARRVHAAWGARAYFMSHDEVRVLNQDAACRRRDLDAGAILAANVKECIHILRQVNPGGRIYVWSDMFDPTHNAVKDYYLVRGDLAGSWEGLDRHVIIAAWHHEKRAESLEWFARRGHRVLIAGYYDGEPEGVRSWLEAAESRFTAAGLMYTTWRRQYDDLERFARAAGFAPR